MVLLRLSEMELHRGRTLRMFQMGAARLMRKIASLTSPFKTCIWFSHVFGHPSRLNIEHSTVGL